MTAASQKTEILAALLAGDELTPMDILNRFKCMRAAPRIEELIDDGYKVDNLGAGGTRERRVRHAIYRIKQNIDLDKFDDSSFDTSGVPIPAHVSDPKRLFARLDSEQGRLF